MYEYEENSEIIGAHCTLLTPYKGYSEGTVVGDFGNKIVVRLSSGKEVVEYRDEVIISSKAGHEMWNGPYGGNSSRKNLMASIDQSLCRTGLDYFDIF